MSLLDDRRESIVLIPEIDGEDDLGNKVRVPDPEPTHWTTLYGRFQMSSSTEPTVDGQVVVTSSVFITRSFPAGAWARITFGGRDWDVDGEVIRSNGSDATKHDTVTLKARGPAPVVV
jgi:hypothetical protein